MQNYEFIRIKWMIFAKKRVLAVFNWK